MTYKRYQYWGFEDGEDKIMWTKWFPWNSDWKPKFQIGRKLLAEYKEED